MRNFSTASFDSKLQKKALFCVDLFTFYNYSVLIFCVLQEMCRQIASALDRLGNAPPPKFADLTTPSFPVAGVSYTLFTLKQC